MSIINKNQNSNEVAFVKYKKQTGETKILLLYLILEGYDLSKIERIVEDAVESPYGLKFKKIYGITTEYIDRGQIEKELSEITSPVIYSPKIFELYSNAHFIYSYSAKEETYPLYINDLGIISPVMIISKDYIVSSNKAKSLEDSQSKGFMYFVDYYLNGKCRVGSWEIRYDKNEFSIYYITKSDEGENWERIYYAVEIDKSSTYKLTLYVIKKAVEKEEEFQPDNFEEEVWEIEQ